MPMGSTFVLNPDTVVAEDTFTKVLAFAENKKDLGIVG
jgi:GT2 family glycosyltransferase